MNELEAQAFNELASLSKEEIKAFIQKIAEKALAGEHTGTPIEIPIENYFSEGVYAREMTMPKGSFVIGKIHKFRNLNFLLKGEVSILSIDGVMRIKAPYTFVASPGAQRVFYAHEEAIWTVVHGTNETDVNKIEEQFIAKDYSEIEGGTKCLG